MVFVFLFSPNEHLITLDVNMSDTVASLKQKTAGRLSSKNPFTLVFEGQLLEDFRILSEYGLKDGSVIDIKTPSNSPAPTPPPSFPTALSSPAKTQSPLLAALSPLTPLSGKKEISPRSFATQSFGLQPVPTGMDRITFTTPLQVHFPSGSTRPMQMALESPSLYVFDLDDTLARNGFMPENVKQCLRDLKTKGARLAIASFNASAVEIIRENGVEMVFDIIVCGWSPVVRKTEHMAKIVKAIGWQQTVDGPRLYFFDDVFENVQDVREVFSLSYCVRVYSVDVLPLLVNHCVELDAQRAPKRPPTQSPAQVPSRSSPPQSPFSTYIPASSPPTSPYATHIQNSLSNPSSPYSTYVSPMKSPMSPPSASTSFLSSAATPQTLANSFAGLSMNDNYRSPSKVTHGVSLASPSFSQPNSRLALQSDYRPYSWK